MTAQFRALQLWCNQYWLARAPRERVLIAVSAALLVGGLSLWLVQAVDRSRAELLTSVPALRARKSPCETVTAGAARNRSNSTACRSRRSARAGAGTGRRRRIVACGGERRSS